MGIIVIYSQISRNDLRDIYDYIKQGSIKYAKSEVDSIRSFIRKLKLNIYLGKPFENSNNEHLREVIYKSYRIIYEIKSDTQIYILTIHHQARSFANNPALGE